MVEKLTALIPPTKEQTAFAPEQPLVLSSSTEKHPSAMSAEAIEESHNSTTQEPSVLLATEEVEVGNM